MSMPRTYNKNLDIQEGLNHFIYDSNKVRRVNFVSQNIQVIKTLNECDFNLVILPNIYAGVYDHNELHEKKLYNFVHHLVLRNQTSDRPPGIYYNPANDNIENRELILEKGFFLEALYKDITRARKYIYTNDEQEFTYMLKYNEALSYVDGERDPIELRFTTEEAAHKNIPIDLLVKSIIINREIYIDKLANIENIRIEYVNLAKSANSFDQLQDYYDGFYKRMILNGLL